MQLNSNIYKISDVSSTGNLKALMLFTSFFHQCRAPSASYELCLCSVIHSLSNVKKIYELQNVTLNDA